MESESRVRNQPQKAQKNKGGLDHKEHKGLKVCCCHFERSEKSFLSFCSSAETDE
jgi:hypothetical protein